MNLRTAYQNGREVSRLIRGYSENLREMTKCLESASQAHSETIPVGRELADLHQAEIRAIGYRLTELRVPRMGFTILERIAHRTGMIN